MCDSIRSCRRRPVRGPVLFAAASCASGLRNAVGMRAANSGVVGCTLVAAALGQSRDASARLSFPLGALPAIEGAVIRSGMPRRGMGARGAADMFASMIRPSSTLQGAEHERRGISDNGTSAHTRHWFAALSQPFDVELERGVIHLCRPHLEWMGRIPCEFHEGSMVRWRHACAQRDTGEYVQRYRGNRPIPF